MNDPNLYAQRYFVLSWATATQYYMNGISMHGKEYHTQILQASSHDLALKILMAAMPHATECSVLEVLL